MIELDDCGKTIAYGINEADTKIYMVIKAPRGIMALYDQKHISQDTQCEAIRAFMEEHSHDED